MLTKGIIQSIDLTTNRCVVRIPLFETAGNKSIFTANAVISILPGIYNGYSVNDVVVVGFGSGGAGDAVVIGKLYLGAATEKASVGGSVHCSDFVASNSMQLPADVKLGFASDAADSNTAKTSKTIDISSYQTLKSLATAVASNARDITELEEDLETKTSAITTETAAALESLRQELIEMIENAIAKSAAQN